MLIQFSHAKKSYNMTLPDWVAPVYSQMEKLAPLFFDSRVLVPTDEAKKVKAGPLLSFLVNNMEKVKSGDSKTSKMYALSGHDTTSSIALGTLGVFETQFPAYASAAIFELHKVNKDHQVRVGRVRAICWVSAFQPFVHPLQVFFRNDTSVPPYEFEIPGCGYPCPYPKFKQMMTPLMVEGEEWEKACKAGGASSPTASKSATSVSG